MSDFEKKKPGDVDSKRDDATPHITQPIVSELASPPADHNAMMPALRELQDRCELVIAFLRDAEELSHASALRLGVSPCDLLKLQRPNSPTEREEAISRIKTHLTTYVAGHTGSFPDYGRYAQRIEDYLQDMVENVTLVQDRVERENVTRNSPERVAYDLASVLSTTIHLSGNSEQIQTSDDLLDCLLSLSRAVMPEVAAHVAQEILKARESS